MRFEKIQSESVGLIIEGLLDRVGFNLLSEVWLFEAG